jgi:hypothetical protein
MGKIEVPGHSGQIDQETPSPKIIRTKWTEGVPQVAECLCKHKAPSSNPVLLKKISGVSAKRYRDL